MRKSTRAATMRHIEGRSFEKAIRGGTGVQLDWVNGQGWGASGEFGAGNGGSRHDCLIGPFRLFVTLLCRPFAMSDAN